MPKRFLPIWALGWGVIAAALILGTAQLAGWWPSVTGYLVSGGVLFVLATAFWRLLGKSFVIDSMGDAARYLTPRPANIEHRQEIREAGVDLLHSLHVGRQFDRITIVGHSLGSVIAYDIITHYWIRTHQDHLRLPRVSNKGVTAVERGLKETDPQSAQTLQHEAWKRARANAQPWLVSDLVTLGSPLSMADFLMASSRPEFEAAKKDRELPTCPPVHEVKAGKRRISFTDTYEDRHGGKDRTILLLHHAAPFALTRWTNLYFPSTLLGDPIGGRVAPYFGPWVRDVPLQPPGRRPVFLHTCYWRKEGNDANLRQLFGALDLESGRELLEEISLHSPLMYLPAGSR